MRGQSVSVNMWMILPDQAQTVTIAQMGGKWFYVDHPFDLAPCSVTVVLQIDGVESRWEVRLPAGMSAGNNLVTVAAIGTDEPPVSPSSS